MTTSPTISAIAKALLEVQSCGTVAVARRGNQALNSKYANMSDILEAVLPALSESGLVFTQAIGGIVEAGSIHVCRVTTRIIHAESGEWMQDDGAFPLGPPPVSRQGAQILNWSQTHGLALTYAKRYALLGILGIPTGDDKDAQRLSEAMERAGTEPTYSAPPHWTDYTEGRWKVEKASTGKLLGDLTVDEMRAERRSRMEMAPAVQASVADNITSILESLGLSYEEADKGTAEKWPEWNGLTPGQLRTLYNWALNKKKQEIQPAESGSVSH